MADFFEVGVSIADAKGKFLLQILDGMRNAVDEIFLLLPKTTITIGSQHLKNAEENEEVETEFEGARGKG